MLNVCVLGRYSVGHLVVRVALSVFQGRGAQAWYQECFPKSLRETRSPVFGAFGACVAGGTWACRDEWVCRRRRVLFGQSSAAGDGSGIASSCCSRLPDGPSTPSLGKYENRSIAVSGDAVSTFHGDALQQRSSTHLGFFYRT